MRTSSLLSRRAKLAFPSRQKQLASLSAASVCVCFSLCSGIWNGLRDGSTLAKVTGIFVDNAKALKGADEDAMYLEACPNRVSRVRIAWPQDGQTDCFSCT